MSKKVMSNIEIEGAKIDFRNFSGEEGKYNAKGNRNFCVMLDPEFAKTLARDGWNIRYLKPRDENEQPRPYMQVKVSFENVSPSIAPPKIVIMSSKGKTVLDVDSVNILDWAEIQEVDLVIRPYNWDIGDKKGVKGYLKSMYVLIAEDKFEKKWTNAPDSAAEAIGGCGNCDECDGSCKH